MLKSTGLGALAGVTAQNNLVQLLYQITGANMQLTSDQTLTKVYQTGTLWIPTAIATAWASGAFNTACAGGIYTAASKGGTAIVAAAQSYAALTGSGTGVLDAIASSGPFTATPILNLTTGNGAALTANVLIYGIVIA